MKTKEEILNYIEDIDLSLILIEDTMKGQIGDAMTKARGQLEYIRKYHASQFQQEWIPVEVRLPEDTKNVDVTILNEGIGKVVTDWYDKDRKGWTMSRNVIAWKPKPQPYNPTKS